jgi:hypothetical protein
MLSWIGLDPRYRWRRQDRNYPLIYSQGNFLRSQISAERKARQNLTIFGPKLCEVDLSSCGIRRLPTFLEGRLSGPFRFMWGLLPVGPLTRTYLLSDRVNNLNQ